MRPLLPVLVAVFAAAPALAQSDGLTLLGQLDPHPGASYSDIWGYVGPDGREYALLNTWISGGLSVIDVTDAAPAEVAYVPVNGDGSDVEAYGHYAYVTSNGNPTSIIDLTDPTDPALVGTFGSGAHTLSIADGYLYANGNGGVRIWSLADPAAPALVGQYNPYYVHDVLVRGDTMYTAGIFGDGVDIVDVSDKANPALIARFNYPGSGAHNVCADASGSYIFVGDEIGTGQWTRVFDVRDPHDVELVAEIIVDAGSTVHNCHVRDGLIYLAHYGRGAWVFDISDPTDPGQVAYYETGVDAAWTFFPHLPSGKLLVSDISDGLYVLRLDNPPGPSVVPEIEPVSPPIVIPPSGGPFSFRAALTNASSQSQTVDAWVVARLPSGALYPRPVAGPRTVTLAPGQTLGPLTLSARVPAAAPPGVYTVELRVGDYPAAVEASDSFTLTKQAGEAAEAPPAAAEVALGAYPNPFTDRTAVRFALEETAAVRVVVYDARGREVAVLVDGPLAAGVHEAALEGSGLPSGTYFVVLEAGARVERHTLTLVR